MKKVEDYYPITTIKYPDHEGKHVVILDQHLKQYTPPARMSSLEHQLTGQTRALEGVYPGDVELWLNNRPNSD